MREPKVGVYIVLCKVNAMLYIGGSTHILKRWTHHKFMLRQNRHANKPLQVDWNKYGEEAFVFEIVQECSKEELKHYESQWIADWESYNQIQNGYDYSEKNKKIAAVQQRVRQTPEWKAAASERAKKQHAAGKLGRQTWKRG